jgi:NTE family protein
MHDPLSGRVGLALGSGAARGWSHIGVIRALEAAGIEPDVICGTSSGALVGACYAAGRLDDFEDWVRALEWTEVVGLLDLSLQGGLMRSHKAFEALGEIVPHTDIEQLPRRFAAVATDLATGREVWLREGALLPAIRASVALPGLIAPERIDDRWLVDGGLVNPVPVSGCRALGADTVIAVDLNSTLLGRRVFSPVSSTPERIGTEAPAAGDEDPVARFRKSLQELTGRLREQLGLDNEAGVEAGSPRPPSLYEVVANSINIMQVRIGRSRMSGDPPELLVTPHLEDFALHDFDRADEAIEAGRLAAEQALATLADGAGDVR